MQAKTFAIICALTVLFFVLDLIRRQKMTFKYSLFWLGGSATVILLALNHRIVFRLSEMAGFQLPSNFIFFLMMTFFLLLSLFLTVYINEQNSRAEALTQAVGILEYRLNRLEPPKEDAVPPPA